MKNGILKVVLDTGNSLSVDMSDKLMTARFGVLKNSDVWQTADTDGNFVHWYKDDIEVVELSFDELMQMTLGSAY
ncbi:MAG: hypothetical protein K6A38_07005 [Lachnospiraceae bacterium]|nr:hypothetical protein [Lachnospiraceae bacterium]